MSVVKQVWPVWQTVHFHLNSWNTYAVNKVRIASWFCLSPSLVCCLAALRRKSIIVRSVVFSRSPDLSYKVPGSTALCSCKSRKMRVRDAKTLSKWELETPGKKAQVVVNVRKIVS